MFVTASDFNIPPYKIPSFTTAEGETFDAFVDQEESKYLLEVLGPNLYEAFTDGLEEFTEWLSTVPTVIGDQYSYGNDVWEALTVQTGTAPVAGSDWTLIETDNRWLLLKNGNTYMIGDKKYYWDGMVKALKPLIYSKWVEYNSITLTSNGFVTPKLENNVAASPNQFICRSWNEWSRMVGGPCNTNDTLYGYLYYTNLDSGVFDDTFDETFDTFVDYLAFEFTEQGNKNMFDL